MDRLRRISFCFASSRENTITFAGLTPSAVDVLAGDLRKWSALSVPLMPGLLVYPAWALAGLGAGLAFPSFGVVVLSQTTDEDRGRDSAALQLGEGVATSFTTGFGGVLVAAAVGRRIGYTAAFVGIDAVMVAIALVGVLVAGRARSGPPERPHRNGKAGTAAAMPTP